MVALSHLRAFVFVDFSTLNHPSLVWSGFYFVTGFGHQAVMIFFVLSGFLVGGSVISNVRAGKWSWREYAVTRMTRLWIVLIPGLLLTAFWDYFGMITTHSSFYDGTMSLTYNSGPSANPSRYSVMTFLGNLTFLQTVVAPTFGTNGPLWSLANEFWYYFLFPLLFFAITAKSRLVAKLSCAAVALFLCYMLPIGLLTYGLIWLFGVAAFVLHTRFALSRLYRSVLLAFSAMLLAAMLILSRASAVGAYSDFAIGLAFAAMLLPLGQLRQASDIVARPSRLMAEFSYTLYVVHFPLAAFLACYALNNQRFIPNLSTSIIFIGILAVALFYSFGVYLLFEKNTRSVRKMILRSIPKLKYESLIARLRLFGT